MFLTDTQTSSNIPVDPMSAPSKTLPVGPDPHFGLAAYRNVKLLPFLFRAEVSLVEPPGTAPGSRKWPNGRYTCVLDLLMHYFAVRVKHFVCHLAARVRFLVNTTTLTRKSTSNRDHV